MTKIHKKRMILGTMWVQGGKLFEFILLFLLSIVLARGFGPESYGIYSSVLAFLSFFVIGTSFGLEQTISNFVPKYLVSGEKEKAGAILKRAIFIRMIFLGCLLLVVGFFSRPISLIYFGNRDFSTYIFIGSFYIFFKDLSALIAFYYIGSLETKFVTIVDNFALIAVIFSSIILFKGRFGIFSILLCHGVIYLMSFAIYLWNLKDILLIVSKEKPSAKVWSFSRTIWINNLLGYVLGNKSDILMLQWFKIGFNTIALYNIAFSLVSLGSTGLITGLSILSLPILSGLHTKGGDIGLSKGWRMLVYISSCISVPILVFMFIFADSIISVLYSNKYADASMLIQIYAGFSLIGRTLGGGANAGALYAINKEKVVFYVTFLTGLLNVIVNLMLIPNFGAKGALIGTGGSNLVSTGVLFMIINRKIKLIYPLYFVIKIVFASIVSGWVSNLMITESFIGLMTSALIFGFVYIGMLIFLKPFEKKDAQIFENVPIISRYMNFITR